jgi:hypothetical protein
MYQKGIYSFKNKINPKKHLDPKQKLVIHFNHFMTDINAMFPRISIVFDTITYRIKLRNLNEVIYNPQGQKITHNIVTFKPVMKLIYLDTPERRHVAHNSALYFITNMIDSHIKLSKDITSYELNLANAINNNIDINSLFVYFKKDNQLLPYYESNFNDMALVYGDHNVAHFSLDKDVLEAINSNESQHYNLKNIINYNFGYGLFTGSQKGLSIKPNNKKLIINLKPGFTADEIIVIFKCEQLIEFSGGLCRIKN